MSSDRFYLDFNATSPLSKSVKSWLESGEFVSANPMSQHSEGKAARKLINESRSQIFSSFQLSEKDHHLIFHSGATEAMMMYAHSFSELARLSGRSLLVCYSGIDHPAVTSLRGHNLGEHVKFLELLHHPDLSYQHEKNIQAIREKKNTDPDLVILYHHLWVHNETGFVSDLSELSELKKIPDLYVHVDAVQAPGKIESWKQLNLGDVWSFSPHKFGALKGIGMSFSKKTIPLHALFPGGGQQQGFRGGTENPMAIHSISLALKDLELVRVSEIRKKKDDLEAFLSKELDGIGRVLSRSGESRNANTIYFYLKNLSSDVSLALFDLNGLMLSAGSACSSGAAKPSAVLLKSGLPDVAKNGLRLSLGFSTSDEDLGKIKKILTLIFSKIHQTQGQTPL